MLKTVFLFISLSGLATFVGCAGERRSTGLVTRMPTHGDAIGDAIGTPYALVFSAINAALNGSGATTVSVKLKNGNVVVTDGDFSKVMVTLKYRVSNTEDDACNPEGDVCFKEFATGGKLELRRGARTFKVQLEAGRVHQLHAETVVNDKNVWGESGIFSVPDGEEQTDVSEESP